jgi:hypothetical protein
MHGTHAGSKPAGTTGRRRSFVKALLIFLVLMTGPILCTIFYMAYA